MYNMDLFNNSSIKNAINEDNQDKDLATLALVNSKQECSGSFITRTSGIVAGTLLIKEIYRQINSSIKVEILKEDGDYASRGDAIASFKGKMIDIIKGHNVVVNYLEHLSGIASIVDKYVEELKGTNCELLYNYHFVPGLKDFEFEAVKAVGGNLRLENPGNEVIITEQQLLINNSITDSVEIVRKKFKHASIEVEVKTKEQFLEAIDLNIQKICLINMKEDLIKELLNEFYGDIKIGASGPYAIGKVRSLAKLGLNYIVVDNLNCLTRGLEVYLKLYKRSIN